MYSPLRTSLVLILLLAAVIGGSGLATAQVRISRLEPWGGQRGTEALVIVHGTHFVGNPRLQVGLSAPVVLITEGDLAPKPERLAFRVPIGMNEACGVRQLRVLTDDGFSNVVKFRVGSYPEESERPPNDDLSQAQDIQIPGTVNGDINGADLDYYRFNASKGQRLVCDVEARRLGSSVDPTLQLLNSGGRALEMSEDTPGLSGDCRIDYTFDADGVYYLRVHDALFSPRSPAFYRLTVGDHAYAAEVFPLGGRAGSESFFEFRGGSLDAPVFQTARLPDQAGVDAAVGLPPLVSDVTLPMSVRVSDLPEILEARRTEDAANAPQEIQPAVVVNGRIALAGEIDRYAFATKPGSLWRFRVDAEALGSRLDSYLQIYDQNGSLLTAVDDARSNPDAVVDFKLPGHVTRVVVSIEDLHLRGGIGFGYRLEIREMGPSFELRPPTDVVNVPRGATQTLAVDVTRQGYDGPVKLAVSGTPVGLNATFLDIPAGATRGFVSLTAPTELALGPFDLQITGRGQHDGRLIECRARGLLHLCRDSNDNPVGPVLYESLAATVGESVPLSFTASELEVLPSFDFTVPVKLVRGEGATGEIVLHGMGTKGVIVKEGKVAADKSEGGAIATISVDTPVGQQLPIFVTASSTVGSRHVKISSRALLLTTVAPFTLGLPPAVEIRAGGEAEISGKVQRRAPFKGVVSIKTTGLPAVKGEQAVNVEADADDIKLTFMVPADFAVGDHKLELAASTTLTRDKKNATYTMPPVTIVLHVAPPAGTGTDTSE
jgi:hypothetical protein